ncbi:MAG: DotU family type IV/VI secretion system protein [Deltaproteobacteria bacterium]|nr:MAG: DotU family type IV/VI secretion system protein [Deltaproteobacteria bacterium]
MRLSDYFINLVAYVAYFIKNLDNHQPSFEQIKTDIQQHIDEIEKRFSQDPAPREDFDLARFAIFAWVDESIMNSSWQEREQWQGELLQRVHFQTTAAGELFFERLNSLGLHQRDVREVYYLCLAMGFTGRFCNAGDEYLLEQLMTSNLKILTGSSVGIPSITETELFPEAYPPDSAEARRPGTKNRFSLFTMGCIGFPVLLFGGLYLIYWFILNSVSANF